MSGSKKASIKVIMLDDTVQTFKVQSKSQGRDLYEEVIKSLNLVESNYFDLEYTDISGVQCWLDSEKAIMKQVNTSNDLTFRLSVKFYTPDPGVLEEEYTRYLFALQIKRDLSTGILPVTDNTAALLAAYIAQSEFGDFNPEECFDHTYLQTFHFVPNQTDEMESKIMEYHKTMVGQNPAEADYNLLDTARKVEMYGLRMHHAKTHDGSPLNLAVANMGILVYQNSTRINTFSWAKIRKLSFKRKLFLVKLHPDGAYYNDIVEFNFDSRNECKNFWKKCIEHHAFFRCHTVRTIPRNKVRVLSRGSSFRYSGKTQKQLVDYVREHGVKTRPFERSQSMRSTRSAGNKSSTLNSRDAPLSTLSASTGSRIMDISTATQPPSSTHTEMAEVHDETTNGNKQSLSSPEVTIKTTSSDIEQSDQTGAAGDSKNDISVVSQPLDLSINNSLSASQNANDNDETQGSYHLDIGVVQLGSEPIMNSPKQEDTPVDMVLDINRTAPSELCSNDINNEDASKEMSSGSDSEDDEDDRASGDVPYILHRRQIETKDGALSEVTVGRAKMADVRPQVKFTTFRATDNTAATSNSSGAPKSPLAERMKARLSSGSSSDGTKPANIVHVNKLPPKNSYSSMDDTASPSLEKEIFQLMQNRKKDALEDEKCDADVFEVEKSSLQTSAPSLVPQVQIEGPTPLTSPSAEEPGTEAGKDDGHDVEVNNSVFASSSNSSSSSRSSSTSSASSTGDAIEELHKLAEMDASVSLIQDEEEERARSSEDIPVTIKVDEPTDNGYNAELPPPPPPPRPIKNGVASSKSKRSSSSESDSDLPAPPCVENESPLHNGKNAHIIRNPFADEPQVCNHIEEPHIVVQPATPDPLRKDYEPISGNEFSSPEHQPEQKEESPDQLDNLEDLSGDSTSDTSDDEDDVKPKMESSSDSDNDDTPPPVPPHKPASLVLNKSPMSPGMSRHIVGIEMSPDRKVITTVHKEIQNGQVIENRHTEVVNDDKGEFFTNPYADINK